MATIKIELKQHLAEYLYGKYSGCNKETPVRIPSGDDLYHLLWDLLTKRPDNSIDAGNVEIHLPDRRVGKNPDYYNYLGKRSVKILQKKVEQLFFAEVHDRVDYNKMKYGTTFIESIHIFMCSYNITGITEDALLKNYQRWRDDLRRKNSKKHKKQLFI